MPRGTHSWKKFMRPAELAKLARHAALEPYDITGLAFDPLKGAFALSGSDLDVNYLISAKNLNSRGFRYFTHRYMRIGCFGQNTVRDAGNFVFQQNFFNLFKGIKDIRSDFRTIEHCKISAYSCA